jgi:hypothetical protein
MDAPALKAKMKRCLVLTDIVAVHLPSLGTAWANNKGRDYRLLPFRFRLLPQILDTLAL